MGAAPNSLPARIEPAAARLGHLTAQDVSDVALHALDIGDEIVAQWHELKPAVVQLTALVREHVEHPEAAKWRLSPAKSASLLHTIASVAEKMARAGQSMLKAAEGQARIAIALQGGVPARADLAKLSEKQLAAIVIEAAKRMHAETGTCPVCDTKPVVEVAP